MYKYTYLLSQSYRSEAGIERGREVAAIERGRKELGNVEVGLKVVPRHVIKRKQELNTRNGDRNVQHQIVEKSFGRVEHGKQLNSSQNIGIDVRNDKNLTMARGSSQMKVKSIAEKYSHQPNSSKNNEKPLNIKPLQSHSQSGQQNKAYQQYKELKISDNRKPIIQYQTNIDHMPKKKHLDYSPINQIKVERQPLRQANNKPTSDQDINRTRVRQQINSYLQNPKQDSQNYHPASKKYIYIPPDKQATPAPTTKLNHPSTNLQQSSQTLAKLSSLQERIKTTIGSYPPA